jgi:hypothetical protein
MTVRFPYTPLCRCNYLQASVCIILAVTFQGVSSTSAPPITSVSPSLSSYPGGAELSVVGSGFQSISLQNPRCKWVFFSDSAFVLTTATVVSDSLVTCLTSNISDTVINDGQETISANFSVRFSDTVESTTLPFTLYNNASSILATTALFPNQGASHLETEVVLRGQGFINSTFLRCFLGTAQSISATFINSTQVLCRLPPLSADSETTLGAIDNVSLSLEGTADSRILPGVPFSYKVQAPTASASLTSDGLGIVISFSAGVEPRPDNCSLLFGTSSALSQLGAEATCAWITESLLRISLKSDSPVILDGSQSLTLVGNSFRRKGSLQELAFFIEDPIVIPNTDVGQLSSRVVGPASYVECEQSPLRLALDLQGRYGFKNAAGNAAWTVVAAGATGQRLLALSTFLSTQAGSSEVSYAGAEVDGDSRIAS